MFVSAHLFHAGGSNCLAVSHVLVYLSAGYTMHVEVPRACPILEPPTLKIAARDSEQIDRSSRASLSENTFLH